MINNLKWVFQPLSLFAIGMLTTLNITLYLFWYSPGLKNLEAATEQLGESLVRNLAFEATSALHSSDRVLLSNLLNRFAEHQTVIRTTVNSEEQGGIQLSSRTKMIAGETGRTFDFPIHFSDELLGYAQIELSEVKIIEWRSLAVTSWILFNVLSAASLAAFIYIRTQAHEKKWQNVSNQLKQQLPDLHDQLSGPPETQLTQLMELLSDPISQHAKLIQHLQKESKHDNAERLLEQIERVDNDGAYREIALLSVQCQNWEALIRTYPSNELQLMWTEYEDIVIKVSELYASVLLPDGFSLAFGLNDDEDYALSAVCAARVLHIALSLYSASQPRVTPIFGICVSAGPAFTCKTVKHGIPLPMITGDVEVYLSQIKALQPANQIFIAEPVLQDEAVNQQVSVTFFQDINLRDGTRLEVWELEGMRENDDLFTSQAETLIQSQE